MITKENGFTLIELIVVVALISILSAVGIGLLSSPSQFQPSAISEAWINQLRFFQRQGLAKTDLSQTLTLNISQSSSEWLFVISQGSNTLDTFEIEHYNLSLRGSTSNFSSACSALSAMAFPITLRVNGYGDLVDGSGNAITSNQRLCVAGGIEKNWCLSPSGYAYGGACVP